MKGKWLVLLMLIFFNKLYAQRFEIGLMAGGNNIIGDIGSDVFINPNGVTSGLLFKWNKSDRLVFRSNIYYSMAKGGSGEKQYQYPYVGKRKYTEYSKKIWSADVLTEWNFFPYHIKEKFAHTPYITLGLGTLVYIVDDLRLGGTLSIPFGVGYKMAFNSKVSLGVDLNFRKTFSDNLDDTNVNRIGRLDTNDWMTTIGLTLTYMFGREPCACGQ